MVARSVLMHGGCTLHGWFVDLAHHLCHAVGCMRQEKRGGNAHAWRGLDLSCWRMHARHAACTSPTRA